MNKIETFYLKTNHVRYFLLTNATYAPNKMINIYKT